MQIVIIKNTSYKIAQVLFLLGVFIKQFYLFPSGVFQLGDLCFMASFFMVILFVLRFKIPLTNVDGLILLFVGCVTLINFIYLCIYGNDYSGEFRFQKSIIYYIFNLFIVLTFRQFSVDISFLKKLRLVLQTGLLVQLAVSLLGLGRYESIRYMGTFNDPNQCGFFLLSSFLLIFIISEFSGEGHPIIWFFVAFFLVLRTVSTGMLLGMGVFLIVYLYIKLSQFNKKSSLAFISVVLGIIFIFILYLAGVLHMPSVFVNSAMYKRVFSKMWSFGVVSDAVQSDGIINLFVDRCWDRLIDYPTKIFYGAGEGYFNRFPSARYINNEIHSSILGPLFYYGIVPCTIWFIWIAKQLKGIKRELWAAYIALIVESVTLVNNRQPFFWMIFVLAGSCLVKNKFNSELNAESEIPEKDEHFTQESASKGVNNLEIDD